MWKIHILLTFLHWLEVVESQISVGFPLESIWWEISTFIQWFISESVSINSCLIFRIYCYRWRFDRIWVDSDGPWKVSGNVCLQEDHHHWISHIRITWQGKSILHEVSHTARWKALNGLTVICPLDALPSKHGTSYDPSTVPVKQ